jgi:Protein of unknown function (DUF2795)
MERGSDKHGPRVDEELSHEVEGMVRGGHSTHAEEWKDPEPSGEDQPDVDAAPNGTLEGGTPDGMSARDVEDRSQLAGYLGKEIYPATADQILERAAGNEAPDSVLAELRRLPKGRQYANLQEVWTDLGGGVEQHRS